LNNDSPKKGQPSYDP